MARCPAITLKCLIVFSDRRAATSTSCVRRSRISILFLCIVKIHAAVVDVDLLVEFRATLSDGDWAAVVHVMIKVTHFVLLVELRATSADRVRAQCAR